MNDKDKEQLQAIKRHIREMREIYGDVKVIPYPTAWIDYLIEQAEKVDQLQQEIERLRGLADELNNELFSERMTIDKLEWQLQQAQKRIQHLENELRNCGYSDTDLDNDFLWEFQDKQVGWEEE
ncbi:hypothetical protein [Parageobacillus thermoglucosidasius]|uniref:hypothetical protein n=1 Tax=Parageobacillus thermoglucosidasius TaxID=1426 RepID=UPI0001D170E0|nr:hypothetical protein [Parageobacillus thermoglucosidasius]AEH46770.1 hypothetical protein Geoth_0772 [Parageobacillus thermoglucosidasius C56-YS93]